MELKNKQLLLETTNICDANCVICPRELYKRKLECMDMGLFKKIIDDAEKYKLTSIDTCGYGEALLDKHLFQRLAYIRKKLPLADIFVSTTAFHLTPEKWEAACHHIDTLKLSIYGATKETYEAFHRGKLKYEVAMDNIMGFLEYAKQKKVKPYTVGLFVITDLNIHEKFMWIRKWENRLDEIFVWKPHNWVLGRNYRTVDLARQVTCGRPDNGPMYVRTDGTVGPCCWDIHGDIQLGDLTTQTIEEVYRGEPYQKLRRNHKDRNFDDYICKNCDQTNFDPTVLVHKSREDRKVGQLTANMRDLI